MIQRLLLIVCLLFLFLSHVSAQQQIAQDAYGIFQQSCLICHGPDGAYRETLFMEHSALLQGGSVVPGNPDGSELYRRLITTDAATRMPAGQPQLSPQAINTIRNWILAGAPDWTGNSQVGAKIRQGKQEVSESNKHQTLNLPPGARVRIGKGGAGWGDRAAAFSPNGQYLAVSSSIGIWLYDTVNYQEIALLSSQYPIDQIAFSPDGNAIVGASGNGHIQNQVWSIITKEKIAAFTNSQGGTVGAVAFSPNGKTIASGTGWTLILWDVETEQELIRMKSEDFIHTISFSYDGNLVACAGNDGLIKLWDVLTGQLINTFRHATWVHSIAFSPTENILASGSGNATTEKSVKLWDTVMGTEILTIERSETISTVAFSPDGKTLAWIEGFSDAIHLWDVTTQLIVAVYEDSTVFNMDSISFSPDGKSFVTVDQFFGIVKVWDITTGNTIDLGHIRLESISFSPDSTMLASGGSRSVKLWDVNTGDNLANIPIKSRSLAIPVYFLPDGRRLAYRVSRENFTRLWDVVTQTQIGLIHNEPIEWGVSPYGKWAFSPDGKTLASATDHLIELWDVTTRQKIATLEGYLDEIWGDIESVVYSPDGKLLASTSFIEIRLWDIATKQTIKTFEGKAFSGSLSPAVFSPDGTMLVFSQLNVGVKVWNLITRTMTPIHEDYFMAFLPDSSMMLLRSYSHESGETVSVWDAKTSTLFATLDPAIFESWKRPIFSPDGKTLAVMGQDSATLFEPEVIYNQLPRFVLSNINFVWSIPAGTSLIHVPLKVTAVNGVAHPIESIADLYDALGGADAVIFLMTYDSQQGWLGYWGASDTGTAADRTLTDDMGIIAGMKTSATVRLTGDALGSGGSGTITLNQGLNLVGVPLNDKALTRVSDFLALSGIRGNVPVITLNDGGEFKAVGRAGDPGDIPLIGGQGFIMIAQQGATVTILGDAWTNDSGTGASPPIARKGIEAADTTSVLGLRVSIVDEGTGETVSNLHVTVKNLSTDRTVATVTTDDEVGCQLTFVDIETGCAATVGDTLEITAQSPNPFIGVESMRYTITAEDVKRSLIQLPELVAYYIPAETELLANYPNPFNPETWIPYRLAEDAFVTLTIYDQTGQIIRIIDVGYQIAAVYETRNKAVYWDGRNRLGEQVASGIFFYHLSAGSYSDTRRMVILK